MINRTYPSECSIFNCDYMVVSQIRTMIGDLPILKRYYMPIGSESFSPYIQLDTSTFCDPDVRFWPYHVKVGGTVCSGINNPQTMDYHFMSFQDPVYNLTASGIDFWVETFKLSDYEIWTTYLSADLTDQVRNPSCITDNMLQYHAALTLLPALRTDLISSIYTNRELTDKDTHYREDLMRGMDPFKDLVDSLQSDLDKMIEKCNKTPVMDGWRIE